jgi:hypothetical protein
MGRWARFRLKSNPDRPARRHRETALQVDLVAAFRRLVPEHRALIVSIAQGATRLSPQMAGLMKAMGSLPGASDLVIILPGGQVMWVEVKSPEETDYAGRKLRGGRMSKSQKVFRDAIARLGHQYRLIASMDEFITLLRELALLPQGPPAAAG